jgi:hypothetical protein
MRNIFNSNYCFNSETEVEEKLPFVNLYLLLLQDIDQLYLNDFNLINKSIANKIDDITLSLILLAQPPIEDIQDGIKEWQESVDHENQETILSKLKKDNYNNFVNQSGLIDSLGVVKLIDIYKEYLKLKQV